MNLTTLLIIILVIIALGGGLGPWPQGPYWGTGWQGGSAIWTVLLVILVLKLLGVIS